MMNSVSTADICDMLALPSVQAFYRRRKALRQQGFPEPLPYNKRRWSRAAVEAWLEAVEERCLQGDTANPAKLGIAATHKLIVARAKERTNA